MFSNILLGFAALLAVAPAMAQTASGAGGAGGMSPGSIASTTVFPDPAKVPASSYAPAGSPASSIGGQINMTLAMGAAPAPSASPIVAAPPNFLGAQTPAQKANPRSRPGLTGSGQ